MMNIKDGRYFGVFPILATPFDAEENVDYESLRKLVRFQMDAGVHGLGLFGMASEGYTLLESERERILAVVKEETAGKLPLVISTGHTSLRGAVELSKQAERDGAAALMVMAPSMAKPDGQRLYEYYAGVASAVEVPIMIQDASVASGVNLPTATVARLVREFENVRYIKVESPPTIMKISDVLDATNGEITVFGGMNGVFMFEEFLRGSVGTMPACEFPGVAVAVFNAFRSGDIQKARDIFVRHLPLLRMGTLPGYAMAIHKEILRRLGVTATNNVRNPNAKLDESLQADVDLLMKELAVL